MKGQALRDQKGAEATLRVVLHERMRASAPRLRRLLPRTAGPGENLFFEGESLGGPDLRADFGPASTWAVSLNDRTAFCIVPYGATSPVTVSRFGLRSNALAFGGHGGDDPTRVLRVDPADGLTGVFRDTPVLVRLSRPAEAMSLCAETFRVEDPGGRVPGRTRLSPDGRVLIWRGERLLEPGLRHVLIIAGLRDERRLEVTPHRSAFVPCTLSWAEIAG
jgi:hypothetical protein